MSLYICITSKKANSTANIHIKFMKEIITFRHNFSLTIREKILLLNLFLLMLKFKIKMIS